MVISGPSLSSFRLTHLIGNVRVHKFALYEVFAVDLRRGKTTAYYHVSSCCFREMGSAAKGLGGRGDALPP